MNYIEDSAQVYFMLSFLAFWVAWISNWFRIGKGMVIGENLLLENIDPRQYPINAVSISSREPNKTVEWIFNKQEGKLRTFQKCVTYVTGYVELKVLLLFLLFVLRSFFFTRAHSECQNSRCLLLRTIPNDHLCSESHCAEG